MDVLKEQLTQIYNEMEHEGYNINCLTHHEYFLRQALQLVGKFKVIFHTSYAKYESIYNTSNYDGYSISLRNGSISCHIFLLYVNYNTYTILHNKLYLLLNISFPQ